LAARVRDLQNNNEISLESESAPVTNLMPALIKANPRFYPISPADDKYSGPGGNASELSCNFIESLKLERHWIPASAGMTF
jgi:hypothetical protein